MCCSNLYDYFWKTFPGILNGIWEKFTFVYNKFTFEKLLLQKSNYVRPIECATAVSTSI